MALSKESKLVFTILIIYFLCTCTNNAYAIPEAMQKPVNTAVLLFRFDDPYTNLTRSALEDIQKENSDKIQFTFFDGKSNKAIQNEIINQLVKGNYDLLLINSVNLDENSVENIIQGAKATNKAVILFNVEPVLTNSIANSYSKLFIIGNNSKQAGILQGKIIVDIWNNNKTSIDKNNNNILEYVMIHGNVNNTDTINRIKYSLSTIEAAGIKTKELASVNAFWSKELSKENMEKILLQFDNNIEAIIVNNDDMAIGAIEALQKYGYNKDDKSKYIVVVGIDAIPEARKLVDENIMSGTVIQDANELAKALYTIGINLVNNKPPLENTNYNRINSEPVIEMPFYEYKKSTNATLFR